jgi:protein involved in plasmid replication-relaxation
MTYSRRGNKRPAIVVQERDRHLLRELAVMRIVDREQAKTVAGFGSTTRVNARLLGLTREGLLRRFFLGTTAGGRKALYSLSAKGAALVGVPERGLRQRNGEALAANFFIEHQLLVNQLYCALKYDTNLPTGVAFRRWLGFYKPLTPELRLIPDGYFELQTSSSLFASFLELDLGNESLAVWRVKVQNYLHYALSGNFEKQFGQDRFRVLVIANSERRLQSIRNVVAVSTEKIFWFSSQAAINRDGLFEAVWVRPKSDERQLLVKETP